MKEDSKTNQYEITNLISEKELLRQSLSKGSGGISKANKELLKCYTAFLPEDVSISERRYYFLHNITEIQKCPVCGKKLNFDKGKHTLAAYCSKKCAFSEKGIAIKIEKFRNSCIKKYGCDHPNKNKNIKQKAKNTCIKKYGYDCPSKVDKFKEKRKNTMIEKWGVENPSQSFELRKKAEETTLEHYGVKCPLQSKEVRNKGKETTKKKYGFNHHLQNKDIMNKNIFNRRKSYFDIFKSILSMKDIEPLFSLEEYCSAKLDDVLKFKCLKCNKIFEYKLNNNLLKTRLINCHCESHKIHSKGEDEICEWLYSMGIENIIKHKRKWALRRNLEADIFLPDYNLVIEYNGLYWHSNLYKDNDYHYNKWKFFKDMNIQCVQIFDNEWNNKKDIVKSIILRTLKILKNDIIESDCEVREIESDLFNKFVNENYINMCKGINHSNSVIGLFNESNELLECISLSNISNNNWRIDLYCCDIRNNYSHFGLNKMIESFKSKNKIDSIEMTLDNRFFSPSMFKDNGFELYGIDKPKRYYFSKNNYEFITNFKSLNIEKYDESLNEEELATINNYMWVYDSGRQIIIKNYKG